VYLLEKNITQNPEGKDRLFSFSFLYSAQDQNAIDRLKQSLTTSLQTAQQTGTQKQILYMFECADL
jgi:hypothetical protein